MRKILNSKIIMILTVLLFTQNLYAGLVSGERGDPILILFSLLGVIIVLIIVIIIVMMIRKKK